MNQLLMAALLQSVDEEEAGLMRPHEQYVRRLYMVNMGNGNNGDDDADEQGGSGNGGGLHRVLGTESVEYYHHHHQQAMQRHRAWPRASSSSSDEQVHGDDDTHLLNVVIQQLPTQHNASQTQTQMDLSNTIGMIVETFPPLTVPGARLYTNMTAQQLVMGEEYARELSMRENYADTPASLQERTHLFVYEAHAKDVGELCSISQEEFVLGELITIWPGCLHKFKTQHLDEWLDRGRICPNCRRGLAPAMCGEDDKLTTP